MFEVPLLQEEGWEGTKDSNLVSSSFIAFNSQKMMNVIIMVKG